MNILMDLLDLQIFQGLNENYIQLQHMKFCYTCHTILVINYFKSLLASLNMYFFNVSKIEIGNQNFALFYTKLKHVMKVQNSR